MRPSALLLALAVLPGVAQDAPFRWGCSAGLVSAQAEFRNTVGHRLAPEVGAWASWSLTESLVLRPGVAYRRYPLVSNGYTYKSSRYNDVGVENARWSSLSAGADLCYRPHGSHLSFIGGIAVAAWTVHSYGSFTSIDKINGTKSYSVDDTSTLNEPALSAGLGWTWTRHLGLEGHMTFGTYRKQAYNTLDLRLLWAF